MITKVSLVTVRHRTMLLQYYGLYSLFCTLHPHDICFITGIRYLSIFLTFCTHAPTPLPSGNHQHVLGIYESISVMLCLFTCFVL